MIKKYLSLALVCLLLITANSALVSAQAQTDRTAASIAKVKTAVLKRGEVFNQLTKLEMLNGTKLKGYISKAGEDSFEFRDSKTDQSSSIFYRDVAKVKGNGWSKATQIGVAAVVAGVAAAVLYVVIKPICNEGGC